MSLEHLYGPVDQLDRLVSGPLDSTSLPLILGLAALLGLRHALDPDHLVAVTSLVAARERALRTAIRVGVWWGAGHAATLLAIGIPMIVFEGALPSWLEDGAEKAIGVVIAVLGGRLLWRWWRSGVRLTEHTHPPSPPHRHAHHSAAEVSHQHHGRTRFQALALGALHGTAGSGAVVLLLLATLQDAPTMIAALTLFAATSIVSMALCTAAFAWGLTRPRVERVTNRLVVPGLGLFAIWFGAVYVGL